MHLECILNITKSKKPFLQFQDSGQRKGKEWEKLYTLFMTTPLVLPWVSGRHETVLP